MLEHGGKLGMASRQYGIALDSWLDLSTGINPRGWPAPPIPPDVWRRLPEAEDGLTAVAAEYCGSPLLVAAAGSQPVIQILPALRSPCRAGILSPGYAEHACAWKRKGHQVTELAIDSIEAELYGLDVLVVCNPNNPTGARFAPATLLAWRETLARRGGWLVVDEAFADSMPELSVAARAGLPGLIVLRSMGKFFGLAGARAGFVLAWPELLSQIGEELGPWSVSGATRWIAARALQDKAWQHETRRRLVADSNRLAGLLAKCGLAPAGSTPLFQWVITPDAARLHEVLARRGILIRCFDTPQSIRFGLPGSPQEWQRLETALRQITKGA